MEAPDDSDAVMSTADALSTMLRAPFGYCFRLATEKTCRGRRPLPAPNPMFALRGVYFRERVLTPGRSSEQATCAARRQRPTGRTVKGAAARTRQRWPPAV